MAKPKSYKDLLISEKESGVGTSVQRPKYRLWLRLYIISQFNKCKIAKYCNNAAVDPRLFSSRTCHPDHTLIETLKEVLDERSE